MLLMQLKLSTLLIIIAILFLYYHYFTRSRENYDEPPMRHDYVPYQPPAGDNGLTPIHIQEGFGLTPIDLSAYETVPQYTVEESEYSLAGNVRPDNIKYEALL